MANDYFNHENPLTRHTLGRAEQVNSTFNAIEAAFDKLPSPDQINRGSVAYVLDLGTVNSYVVNFARVPESYTEGMNFTMKAATTNTGPAVINVNGLGAKQIRRYDGQPLEPGDIRAGQLVILGYDGSRFLNIGAQGAEVAKARQWATSTSVVESGLLGARGYAQKADSWANANEDVVVEGGRYSAKHWALKAMSNAGLLPDENLDIPARTYRDLGTVAEPFRDGNFSRHLRAGGDVTGARFIATTNNEHFISRGSSFDIDHESDAPIIRVFRHAPAAATNYRVYFYKGGSDAWLRMSSSGGINLIDGVYTGNGSGLTNVPATSLTGTLPDARLSGDYSFANLTLSGGLKTQHIHVGSGASTRAIHRNGPGSSLTIAGGDGAESGANIHLRGPGLASGNGDLRTGSLWRLRWNADGVTASGLLTATGSLTVAGTITGNGSGLTNVPATSLTGTINPDRLPNHSADLLTSGTLPNGRLSGSYSFASLDLTGALSVAGLATATGGVSTQHLRLGSGTSYAIHRDGDSSWLELAGGSAEGRGGVIRLYGPSSSAHGQLRYGSNARLVWDNDGVRANNGAGGLLSVATVSTTASNATTVFPIGHTLVTENDPGDINRNQNATIRLGDNAREYRVNAGSGDVVGGVWRSRGAGISGVAFERVE